MIERTKCTEIIHKTNKYFIVIYGKSVFGLPCQKRTYKLSNPQAAKLAQQHADKLSKYYGVPINKIIEN